MSNEVNIFICEDHQIMIDGLIQIISKEKKLRVIGHSC